MKVKEYFSDNVFVNQIAADVMSDKIYEKLCQDAVEATGGKELIDSEVLGFIEDLKCGFYDYVERHLKEE